MSVFVVWKRICGRGNYEFACGSEGDEQQSSGSDTLSEILCRKRAPAGTGQGS